MGERDNLLREGRVPSPASSLGAFDAAATLRSSEPQRAGRRLGELLVTEGLLTADDLKRMLADQKRTGRRLAEIVYEHGFASVPTLVKLLARQCQLELQTEKGFGSGLRNAIEQRHGIRRRRTA